MWDLANRAAIVLSLVGFPLGVLGLFLTYREAQRSATRAQEASTKSQEAKTASEAAEDAVRNFRQDLALFTSVADFTKALSMTDEIKHLIRDGTFNRLPDRLSDMRQLLVAIREANLGLLEEQNEAFQSAIVNFRKLEVQIVADIAAGHQPGNIAELTESICNDVDSLHAILNQLKHKIGTH